MRRIFVDSNILIYVMMKDSPFNIQARAALDNLLLEGAELWINEQVIRETVCVLTKPNTTIPMKSCAETMDQVEAMAEQFNFCSESAGVRETFMSLVSRHSLRGARVYDAAIVASMLDAGVTEILTNNPKDFLPLLSGEGVISLTV
jgi:predicted nucleic acid-binding protein